MYIGYVKQKPEHKTLQYLKIHTMKTTNLNYYHLQLK